MRLLPTVLALSLALSAATVPAARVSAQEVEASAAEAETSAAARELDDERARLHFAAGQELFEAGSFAEAAREFALAYELSRRPEMLVNLARAHERDGALRAAIADFELLIAQHPSSSYRGEAEERIARMRAELRATEHAELAKTKADEPSERSTPVLAPSRPAQPTTSRLAWTARGLFAGAIGTGVVALATGLRAHRIYLDLERDCQGDFCEGAFERDRDRGLALARTSTAFTAISLLVAGVSVVTWALDLRARKRAARDVQTSRLVLGGRF